MSVFATMSCSAQRLCAAVAALASIVAIGAAAAQEGGVSVGRFSVEPSGDGGFVRVDTRTGQTSHCASRQGVWSCTPIPEVGQRVEDEMAALGARLDGIDQRLGALESALAAGNEQWAEVLETFAGHVGGVEERIDSLAADVSRDNNAADAAVGALADRLNGIEARVDDVAAVATDGDSVTFRAVETLAGRLGAFDDRLVALETATAADGAAASVITTELAALADRVAALGIGVAALRERMAEQESPATEPAPDPVVAEAEPAFVDAFAAAVIDRFVTLVRRLREARGDAS